MKRGAISLIFLLCLAIPGLSDELVVNGGFETPVVGDPVCPDQLGWGNFGGLDTEPIPFHGRPHSLNVTCRPSPRSSSRTQRLCGKEVGSIGGE